MNRILIFVYPTDDVPPLPLASWGDAWLECLGLATGYIASPSGDDFAADVLGKTWPEEPGLWVHDSVILDAESDRMVAPAGGWRRPTEAELRRLVQGGRFFTGEEAL